MSKLTSTDSFLDAITKMANGNPGAVNALVLLIKNHNSIDPDTVRGPANVLLQLDRWRIYGTNIYILFNDKCKRNTRAMILLIRATEFGFFPLSRLKKMSEDQDNINRPEWEALDQQVCSCLPRFIKPPKTQVAL